MPNFGLDLTSAGAAHSVVSPPCLLSAFAAQAHVGPISTWSDGIEDQTAPPIRRSRNRSSSQKIPPTKLADSVHFDNQFDLKAGQLLENPCRSEARQLLQPRLKAARLSHTEPEP